MQKLELWHNISCSKSNGAKNYLDDNGINIKVKNYLDSEITKDELKELLKKLNITIFELIRTTESIYKELSLEKIEDEDILLDIVLKNPILIQRPILVGSSKAFIVRPPLKIEDVLKEFDK